MSAKITTLIDKQDTFEIVRDKIADILVTERDEQKNLAVIAGKDPALWDFEVYVERSTPWELLEDNNGKILSDTPLVNIYFNEWSPDPAKSDLNNRQQGPGIFIIDCLSAKNTTWSGGTKIGGDKLAAFDTQRIVKLVRNILQAAVYLNLDMTASGIVGDRITQKIQMFQPEIDGRQAQHVVGARIFFQVEYVEYSPEMETSVLEYVSVVNKDEEGRVISQADFDYTEP